MVKDVYYTIEAPTQGVYKEKGSKFLSFAFPVVNTEEVKIHLEALRKEYFDARHHCYAYILDPEQKIYRMNDDGEPSSTAGKPIYGQLLSYGLTQVLVVVVRYFGGTKLGTSGLLQAYKTATEEALKAASIIEKNVQKSFRVEFSYPQIHSVMKILKEENLSILSPNFGDNCTLIFSVRLRDIAKICKKLQESVVVVSEC
ncbi:MAG: YigZ family protein [Bacteroidales bacterium]